MTVVALPLGGMVIAPMKSAFFAGLAVCLTEYRQYNGRVSTSVSGVYPTVDEPVYSQRLARRIQMGDCCVGKTVLMTSAYENLNDTEAVARSRLRTTLGLHAREVRSQLQAKTASHNLSGVFKIVYA